MRHRIAWGCSFLWAGLLCLGCGSSADGGFDAGPVDGRDGDAGRDDAGNCVDNDGDEHGPGCLAGADCDDADPGANLKTQIESAISALDL